MRLKPPEILGLTFCRTLAIVGQNVLLGLRNSLIWYTESHHLPLSPKELDALFLGVQDDIDSLEWDYLHHQADMTFYV